ncbi:hypothetical protein GGI15_004394 [Coemansia interrupta]|uniref:Lipid droplet-associated hydrolase n=1 Tax=Coemansia interrupta TaxID=1126814 RepID=A0A9W8HA42_9FUNG|nr:hypothetical protein GGI15_004394 [Coemansia interrupta]
MSSALTTNHEDPVAAAETRIDELCATFADHSIDAYVALAESALQELGRALERGSMSFRNQMPLPLRTSWPVAGELRETIFWPSQSGAPQAVMFVIPGNPGLVDFYIDFCSLLHKKFHTLEIIGVSHLGHTRFANNRGVEHRVPKTHSLEEQVANMVAVFDAIDQEYSAENPRPKMLLLGHSVGCYFAQKIIECREDRVDRVYALFPAVAGLADSPRGRQLRLMFQPGLRQTVALVMGFLRWLLPLRLLYHLADHSESLNAENSRVVNSRVVVDKMLFGRTVACILHMASDEMRIIDKLNEPLYRRLGERFVMFYGVDDQWVPIERYERMKEVNTKGQVVLCEKGISHAFVTAHSTDMAKMVAKALKREFETTGTP